MVKNYLLTYQCTNKNCKCIDTTFSWFNTEEEMEEFIEKNNIQVIDMLKINDAENFID